jgi:hypothetical protein
MPEDRLHAAINRILRTWSLIKMVPEHRLSALRILLLERLSEQRHMTENELVVLGLKYLHQDGPNVPWNMAPPDGKIE